MPRVFALLLIFFAATAPPARAETYRLGYEAVILGVVVLGEARYDVTATPSRYAVRATLRTSGAARVFDQTNITAAATGAISGNTIGWARYDLSHAYAQKFRRIQMLRTGGAITSDVAPAYGNMGEPPATDAQRAQSYDPLTAMFALGRQVGVARACRGAVLVFDGRQHYRLSVTPKGQANFNSGGYNGPALSCNFHFQPIAGFSAGAGRAIPGAEAWFGLPAQPGFAPPLRITIPTPVGAAQINLRNFQNGAAPAS